MHCKKRDVYCMLDEQDPLVGRGIWTNYAVIFFLLYFKHLAVFNASIKTYYRCQNNWVIISWFILIRQTVLHWLNGYQNYTNTY